METGAVRHGNERIPSLLVRRKAVGFIGMALPLPLLLGPGGVFGLEPVVLFALGFSWAVKGEAVEFLNDRRAPPPTRGASRRPTWRKTA